MRETLLVLHFLALGMGLGGGLANIIAKRQMPKADPASHPGMALASAAVGKMSAFGLALLWITGIWMTALKFGLAEMPMLLWLKIALVAVMTAAVIRFNLMMIKAKKSKTPPDGAKMNRYAYAINSMAVLAVIIAVVQFR